MAQKDLFALSSISAATCAAARTCDAHMLITSIYLTNTQLASLASLVWPCCASSHRMQPYTPTVLTGSGVTVLVASISVTLVTCGLGWCCLRCYCWLGCQWRDGRRPLAPLQQRLLRRGKIRISCPEPADVGPHICVYTTSVWAAQAKPRSSQLATVWPLAVVSHSWCTSSQEGRLNTIVRRREKSSIHEIQSKIRAN